MANTQLRTYPYKREAIRACLLSLLSDDHIRTVSPTTRRLVERNLKADWCAVLSPAPQDQKVIDAEAKLAQQISAIALQDPVTSHATNEGGSPKVISESPTEMKSMFLRAGNGVGPAESTLSVFEVADADQPRSFLPFRRRKRSSVSEHTAGKSMIHEHPHAHGHAHAIVEMPHHHHLHHHGSLNASTPQLIASRQGSVDSTYMVASASAEALSNGLRGRDNEIASSLSIEEAQDTTAAATEGAQGQQ